MTIVILQQPKINDLCWTRLFHEETVMQALEEDLHVVPPDAGTNDNREYSSRTVKLLLLNGGFFKQ